MNWPVGAAAEGNEAVAAMVQKTSNSIGYVELVYALRHQLNFGAVRNAAGEFVLADLASVTLAAKSAPGSLSPERGPTPRGKACIPLRRLLEEAGISPTPAMDADRRPKSMFGVGIRASAARDRQSRITISGQIRLNGGWQSGNGLLSNSHVAEKLVAFLSQEAAEDWDDVIALFQDDPAGN